MTPTSARGPSYVAVEDMRATLVPRTGSERAVHRRSRGAAQAALPAVFAVLVPDDELLDELLDELPDELPDELEVPAPSALLAPESLPPVELDSAFGASLFAAPPDFSRLSVR